MSERRSRYVVEVVPDIQSAQQTTNLIKSIKAEFAQIDRTRALDRIARDAANLVNEGGSARIAMARLQAELVKIGANEKEVQQVARQFDRLRENAEEAARAAAKVDAQTRFDQVSRDVGLAGDIQSNLGAVSALTGNQNIAVAGEFAALVEELPRLKTALAGLPGTLKSAAQAIGAPGLGLIAATAALTVALGALQSQAAETQRIFSETLQAQRDANELARSGTREQIEAEIERRRAILENAQIERDRLQNLKTQFEDALNDQPVLAVANALRSVVGADAEFKALGENLATANSEINAAQQSLILLERALADGGTQARLTAEAEAELAAQRQALTDSRINNAIQTRLQFEGQSVEAIQDRIGALQREGELIQEAINEGRLSADATQDLRDRYAELADEIRILQRGVLPLARASEETAAALADEKRQRDETIAATRRFNQSFKDIQDTAAQDRLKIEQDYADEVTKLAEEYTADIEDANRKLADKLSDLSTELARDAADAERETQQSRIEDQIAFNQETAKQSRDLQRELQKIREDSAAQEAELVRNRDFADLQRLRTDQRRSVDQAVDNFNAEQREREIAFRQQQEQTNRELQFEAEARRIQFEQRVADARAAYAQERADLERNRREQEQRLLQSRNRELQIVSDTQNNKLRLLAQAYNQELQLAAQTAQQRIALQRQTDAALMAQARLIGGIQAAFGQRNSASFANTFNINSGASAAQTVGTGIAVATEVSRQLRQIFG